MITWNIANKVFNSYHPLFGRLLWCNFVSIYKVQRDIYYVTLF